MYKSVKFWLILSILNILIVSFIGVVMRIKIAFEFPYFDQKQLQHAHSHFAFTGWISQTLMVLIFAFLKTNSPTLSSIKYYRLLIIHTLLSYGMLVSFTISGYSIISNILSFSTIVVTCVYFYWYRKDSKVFKHPSIKWFNASLLFYLISSLGTFTLAIMMINHYLPQNLYLSTIYFYLHFQYNGWFLFACMGLFMHILYQLNKEHLNDKTLFLWFVISCIPAYLFSILWMKLPIWVYIIVISAAIAQLTGYIILLKIIRKYIILLKSKIKIIGKILLLFACISLGIKILLQLGSIIPSVNQFAYGFRSVVIAYLHLVLLGIISIFLWGYIYIQKMLHFNKFAGVGLILFTTGVYLNEIVLAIQGIASVVYFSLPYGDIILLFLAFLMFSALLFILSCIIKYNWNKKISS